jgi:hypothetical protein
VSKVDLSLQQFIGQFFDSYRVIEGPRGWLDLLAGFRYTYLGEQVGLQAGASKRQSAPGSTAGDGAYRRILNYWRRFAQKSLPLSKRRQSPARSQARPVLPPPASQRPSRCRPRSKRSGTAREDFLSRGNFETVEERQERLQAESRGCWTG